jgi:hypothetical protein
LPNDGRLLNSKVVRSVIIYGIIAWMAINIILVLILLLGGDTADFNNWLEIALWLISIVGLLSMKKWGAAFAIFTLCYTFSTSLGNIMYFQIWLNAVRVVINAVLIPLIFKWIFDGKFN